MGQVFASIESSLASITEASHTSSGRAKLNDNQSSPIKFENPMQAYGSNTNRSLDSAQI